MLGQAWLRSAIMLSPKRGLARILEEGALVEEAEVEMEDLARMRVVVISKIYSIKQEIPTES